MPCLCGAAANFIPWMATRAGSSLMTFTHTNSTFAHACNYTELPCAKLPPSPSDMEAAALVVLSAAVLNVTSDARITNIFSTWNQTLEPCYNLDCVSCVLTDTACGVFNTTRHSTVCNYKYIECKAGYVTSIKFGGCRVWGRLGAGMCARV